MARKLPRLSSAIPLSCLSIVMFVCLSLLSRVLEIIFFLYVRLQRHRLGKLLINGDTAAAKQKEKQ